MTHAPGSPPPLEEKFSSGKKDHSSVNVINSALSLPSPGNKRKEHEFSQPGGRTTKRLRVSWAPGTKPESISFAIPQEKVPNAKPLKRRILSSIAKNEEEQLDRYFEECKIDQGVLNDFFSKKGYGLYYVSILFYKNARLLSFIIHKISPEVAREVFRLKDFKVLRYFFMQASNLEQSGRYDPEQQRVRIEILTLLLQIDSDGINSFVLNNRSCISELVLEEYRLASMNLQHSATLNMPPLK